MLMKFHNIFGQKVPQSTHLAALWRINDDDDLWDNKGRLHILPSAPVFDNLTSPVSLPLKFM